MTSHSKAASQTETLGENAPKVCDPMCLAVLRSENNFEQVGLDVSFHKFEKRSFSPAPLGRKLSSGSQRGDNRRAGLGGVTHRVAPGSNEAN